MRRLTPRRTIRAGNERNGGGRVSPEDRVSHAICSVVLHWTRLRAYPILRPTYHLEGNVIARADGRRFLLGTRVASALAEADGTRTLMELCLRHQVWPELVLGQGDHSFTIPWPHLIAAEQSLVVPPARRIVLSPHFDDAALSIGGVLLHLGGFHVINVFTRSNWWRFTQCHEDCSRVSTCRAAEDAVALRLLGASSENWDLPEAPRRGFFIDEIFSAHLDDQRNDSVRVALPERIAATAAAHDRAEWWLPAGLGDHIDHRLVREAALAGLARSGLRPANLVFYEDLPYAANLESVAQAVRARVPGFDLEPWRLELGPRLEDKLLALRAYGSQLSCGELLTIRAYACRGSHAAAERAWRPSRLL